MTFGQKISEQDAIKNKKISYRQQGPWLESYTLCGALGQQELDPIKL